MTRDEQVAALVKTLRERARVSIANVAIAADLTVARVREIETCEGDVPTTDELGALLLAITD